MKQRIYVELDCILDTRLASLIRIDRGLASQILSTNYRTRLSDNWEQLGVSLKWDTYKQTYDERDGETLRLAKLTNIVPLLNHIVGEIEQSALREPALETIEVEVNLYPYVCNDDVQKNIVDAVQYVLGQRVKVSVGYWSLDEITPSLIDSRWEAVVLYDFNSWLNLHHEMLKQIPMPRVMFITPALLLPDVDPSTEIYIDGHPKPLSPFAALEMQLVDYLSLRCLDVKYFSLVTL